MNTFSIGNLSSKYNIDSTAGFCPCNILPLCVTSQILEHLQRVIALTLDYMGGRVELSDVLHIYKEGFALKDLAQNKNLF